MLVIPIFVPHAGCPHDCCFCNQKIISGHVSVPTASEVIETILFYRDIAHRYSEVQIAFYGGSFTAIESPLQEMFLSTVQPYLKVNGGFIDCIRMSTRPDCINDETIRRLLNYRVSIVELGAQSMDDKVLRLSQRGHCAEDTKRASMLLKQAGITLGLQTMTGLPGSDRKSDIETSRMIAALKPDFVRIYPTIVIKQTTLCKWLEEGKYVSPSLEDTVDLCAELFCFYKRQNIEVVRMGLQSSDNISDDGEIKSGPYHPAFGQLVHSRIALTNTEKKINEMNLSENDMKGKRIEISVPKGRISDYAGQRRHNSEYLKEKYGFARVKITEDVFLYGDDIRITL